VDDTINAPADFGELVNKEANRSSDERRNDVKSTDWCIHPGRAINDEEMVQSLKERGVYRTGIQQSVEQVAQNTTTTPRRFKLPA